jgi:tetratricopeptide (TPR) repeat protein
MVERRALSRRDAIVAAALFLAALALHVAYLLQLRRTPLFHSPGLDSAYYLTSARAIAAGEGIGSDVFFMGPLYSYVLAIFGRLLGFATERLLLLQSMLGSTGPAVLYLLARRFVSRPWAISAGAAMAAYGMLILYDNLFLMEWLLVLLLLTLLLVLTGATAGSRNRRFAGAGVILGLAALGRASLLAFAPLALLWIVAGAGTRAARGGLRWRWGWSAAFLAGLILAIAPATAHNWILGHDRVLVSANGGLNLFIGNNAIGRGTYLPMDQLARAAGAGGQAVDVSWMLTDPSGRRVAETARGRALKPSEVSRFWSERALTAMRADPARTARIFGRKLLLFWNAIEIPQIEDPALYHDLIPLLRLPLVRFGWVAPLALLGIGLAIAGSERRRWALVLLFIAAFTLSIVVFFVTARDRVPIVPVVILLAAFAGEALVARARAVKRSWIGLAWPVAALIGFAVLVHWPIARFDRSAAYVSLGIALADEGRHDEAIDAFEHARDLAPGDPVAQMNLGTALLKANRLAEAADAFRAGTERFPRTASLWHGLGECEARLEHAAEAATAFRAAAALEPRDPYLWLRLGGAEFAAGHIDSARAAFARGLAVDPQNAQIRALSQQMETAIAANATPNATPK